MQFSMKADRIVLFTASLNIVCKLFSFAQDSAKVSLCKRRGWPLEHLANSTTSRQHLVCLLEVWKAAVSVATWVAEQMRDAIAASDLKAPRSSRGDDELARRTN